MCSPVLQLLALANHGSAAHPHVHQTPTQTVGHASSSKEDVSHHEEGNAEKLASRVPNAVGADDDLWQESLLVLREMEAQEFQMLDLDSSKTLTWSEFKRSQMLVSGYAKNDMQELFFKADLDRDSHVSRQEFVFLTQPHRFNPDKSIQILVQE